MNYFVFSYIYFDLIPTEVHIATYQLHIYERLFEQIHIFRFLVCDTPKKILQNFAGIKKNSCTPNCPKKSNMLRQNGLPPHSLF